MSILPELDWKSGLALGGWADGWEVAGGGGGRSPIAMGKSPPLEVGGGNWSPILPGGGGGPPPIPPGGPCSMWGSGWSIFGGGGPPRKYKTEFIIFDHRTNNQIIYPWSPSDQEKSHQVEVESCVGSQNRAGREVCREDQNSQIPPQWVGNLFDLPCQEEKSLFQTSFHWTFVSFFVLCFACFGTRPEIINGQWLAPWGLGQRVKAFLLLRWLAARKAAVFCLLNVWLALTWTIFCALLLLSLNNDTCG